tara:strand:+ start:88 stop:321 length:234 start_codon:yes stop_codon:yes gene_type:complete
MKDESQVRITRKPKPYLRLWARVIGMIIFMSGLYITFSYEDIWWGPSLFWFGLILTIYGIIASRKDKPRKPKTIQHA